MVWYILLHYLHGRRLHARLPMTTVSVLQRSVKAIRRSNTWSKAPWGTAYPIHQLFYMGLEAHGTRHIPTDADHPAKV